MNSITFINFQVAPHLKSLHEYVLPPIVKVIYDYFFSCLTFDVTKQLKCCHTDSSDESYNEQNYPASFPGSYVWQYAINENPDAYQSEMCIAPRGFRPSEYLCKLGELYLRRNVNKPHRAIQMSDGNPHHYYPDIDVISDLERAKFLKQGLQDAGGYVFACYPLNDNEFIVHVDIPLLNQRIVAIYKRILTQYFSEFAYVGSPFHLREVTKTDRPILCATMTPYDPLHSSSCLSGDWFFLISKQVHAAKYDALGVSVHNYAQLALTAQDQILCTPTRICAVTQATAFQFTTQFTTQGSKNDFSERGRCALEEGQTLVHTSNKWLVLRKITRLMDVHYHSFHFVQDKDYKTLCEYNFCVSPTSNVASYLFQNRFVFVVNNTVYLTDLNLNLDPTTQMLRCQLPVDIQLIEGVFLTRANSLYIQYKKKQEMGIYELDLFECSRELSEARDKKKKAGRQGTYAILPGSKMTIGPYAQAPNNGPPRATVAFAPPNANADNAPSSSSCCTIT